MTGGRITFSQSALLAKSNQQFSTAFYVHLDNLCPLLKLD